MTSFCRNRVVLWSAHQNDLDALRESLVRRGLQVHVVKSLEPSADGTGLSDGSTVVPLAEVNLIVARLCQCFTRPLDLISWLQEAPSPPPVLTVTEGEDVPLYLEAMGRGAFDCVPLPLNEREFIRIVARAFEARPVPEESAQQAEITMGGQRT